MSKGCFIVVLLVAARLHAQPPAIFQDGVSNAASHVASSLPYGGIAPGSRITVRGVRLENPVLLINQRKARTLKVERASAEFLLPRDLRPGPAQLVVDAAGGPSRPFPVTIVGSAFGIQTLRRSGRVVTLEGSGIGNGASEIEVIVGGTALRPSKVSSDAEGNDRIEVRLPATGIVGGCHIPVYVRSPSHVSNFASLVNLPHCAEEPWPILAPAAKGAGSLQLIRTTLNASGRSWTVDSAQASFFPNARQPAREPLWFPLGVGQCRVESEFNNSSKLQDPLLNDPLRMLRLDANGVKTLVLGTSLAVGSRNVPVNGSGQYISTLGGNSPGLKRPKPLFFEEGKTYGVGVPKSQPGRFSVEVPFIDDLEFTPPGVGAFNSTGVVRVTWRTAQPLVVVVLYSQNDTSSVQAICAANGGDGGLTIPAAVIRSLPPTVRVTGLLAGYVGVAAVSAPTAFLAAGIKKSIVSSARFRIEEVDFQ